MFSSIVSSKKTDDGGKGGAVSKKASSSSDLKLPSISNNNKDQHNTDTEDGTTSKKSKKKTKKDKKKPETESYEVPEEFHYWIRDRDKNGFIFYVNSKTRETSPLGPCCICHKISDKWCLQCEHAYCDKHFAKQHRCDEDLEEEDFDPAMISHFAEMKSHRWSTSEVGKKETLDKPGDVYCIECKLRVATKLCDHCWDPYCNVCFDRVHHIGYLKEHKGLNYQRAKLQWHIVKRPGLPDLYIDGLHGGQETEIKPRELMTDLEKVLSDNYASFKEVAEDYESQVESLEKKLARASELRDQMKFRHAQALQVSRQHEGK